MRDFDNAPSMEKMRPNRRRNVRTPKRTLRDQRTTRVEIPADYSWKPEARP